MKIIATNKVNRPGDTMTGELDIEIQDLAPGDITSLRAGALSDDSQHYSAAYTEFGVMDLNPILHGLGKYPVMKAYSDAVLGDGIIIVPPKFFLIDWDGGSPQMAMFGGPSIASISIDAEYDWDGLGSNRHTFSDDVGIGHNLDVSDALTANSAGITGLLTAGSGTFGGIALTAWSAGSWIDMAIGGSAGIGSGGAGANCWLGYAFNNADWFSDSLTGDICYRNQSARLLFGTQVNSSLFIDTSGDVGVASGVKFYLEGAGSDTYLWYNSGASKVELYVNGVKQVEWG